MGIFDVFKKKDMKVNNSNINDGVTKEAKNETDKPEIVKKKYTYKGKNYLSTDGIEDEIKQFEKGIGKIPDELKKFWISDGYGFINQDDNHFNRLLSPSEIIDFINRNDIYEWVPDSEFYDSIKDRGFAIMEYSEYIYFWIGTAPDILGKVFYFDSEICSSFNDLIKKLENDEDVLESVRKNN